MTTKVEIKLWFEGALVTEGTVKDYSHMLVVCDTFDHDDYPVYVKRGDSVIDTVKHYDNKSMQRVVEVYDLDIDLEQQLNVDRVWNVPRTIETIVYLLECVDATELGGPMGSSDTHHLWTKPFLSQQAAKNYVTNYEKKREESRNNRPMSISARGTKKKIPKEETKTKTCVVPERKTPVWEVIDNTRTYLDVGPRIYTITEHTMEEVKQ